MLIAIDGSRAFVKNPTGTEYYSLELIRNLAQIDTITPFLVYLRPGNYIPDNFPSNFRFKMINFRYLWTQIGLSMQLFKDLPDLLFVPAHTLPLLVPGKVKTVVTVHDLGAEFLPAYHQLKQQLYLKFVTNFQLKSATGLIAVSESTKNDLVKKIKLNPKKISVVYEGSRYYSKIDHNAQKIDQVLTKYGLENQNYFLFVGTIQPRKNLARLIEAFALLLQLHNIPKGFKLILVGSNGWDFKTIRALPHKLAIESSVKFLGRINDEELGLLYKGAKAFVYPSLFEGFGLPILEAFHFGCPVITSNTSSMPEIAGDAALLVDPLNLDELIKAMDELLINDILRDRLINKGYIQEKKFSFEKTAEETLALFNQILDNK